MGQFFCTADTCTQDLGSGGGSSNWSCQNLRCTCITNTTFCGAVQLTNLTSIIDTLSGTFGTSCAAPSADNNTATCALKQDTIQQVFGSARPTLSGCACDECVAQNAIDTFSGNPTTTNTDASSGGSSLNGGVIAGFVVVGGVIGIALLFLCLGWLSQRRARNGTSSLRSSDGVTVEWADVSYLVPQPSRASCSTKTLRGPRTRSRRVL